MAMKRMILKMFRYIYAMFKTNEQILEDSIKIRIANFQDSLVGAIQYSFDKKGRKISNVKIFLDCPMKHKIEINFFYDTQTYKAEHLISFINTNGKIELNNLRDSAEKFTTILKPDFESYLRLIGFIVV